MEKFPKVYLIISVALFIAVMFFALVIKLFPGKTAPIIEDTPGITVSEPKPNDAISSPLKIKGTVYGKGWTGFEGQVGIVKLFDNAGKELALGILTATEDWMKLPTNFETTIFFDYPGDGEGKLVFYNENASGEPERNKTFELPVRLTKSSGEKMKVKVYFGSNQLNHAYSCSQVLQVEREVAKIEAVARVALEELLKGPTDIEKHAGFITSINPGVKIQSLEISGGVAKVDFSSELNQGVAGSCRVQAIRAQIEQTLKQFPTVKSVIISVNGQSETILQP